VRRPAALLCCLAFALGNTALARAQAQPCPPKGDAAKAKVQKLNEQKARLDEVGDSDIDDTVTMEELVEPGDDSGRWQDGQGVEITAYVMGVVDGSPASSNCHSGAAADHDTILELAPTAGARDTAHLVFAVITPQWRAVAAAHRTDWSTVALRAQYLQHWVNVRGWLLYNFEAASVALNTASMAGPNITRATAWEIHPVTEIERNEDVFQQQAALPADPSRADQARSNVRNSAP
jgi:hypothetical protein